MSDTVVDAPVISDRDALPDAPDVPQDIHDDLNFDDGYGEHTPTEVESEEQASGKVETPVEETSEEVEETEEEPVGDELPPTKDFSEDLLARAEAVGIDTDMAKDFSSPDSLRDSIRLLERARQRQGSADEAKTSQQQAPLGDLDIPLDEFDDTAKAAFTKVKDHFQAMQQQVVGLYEYVQNQEAERLFDSYDRFLNTLGEEYHDAIGKGTREDVTDPKQIATRREILTLAGKLAEDGNLSKHFQKAVDAVLSDKIRTSERKKIQSSLKKRSNSSVSKPTQRHSETETSDDRAFSFVKGFVKERAE